MDRKKRVVFHSNFCGSKTGFGRHARAILTYLYNTGKYDITEYAAGLDWDDHRAKQVPWKCHGVYPNNKRELQYLQKPDGSMDETLRRLVGYGYHNIDKVIKESKPDVYIGVEDIWAFAGYSQRAWWNKINVVIHTTLDSLPILPAAVEAADKIKNYLVWAEFAEKELHKLGHKHVQTVHGAIDDSLFHRLPDADRQQLRINQNIPLDAFIIGFVFRNQPRKTVDALLEAFKSFTNRNRVNGYLLLHTHWEEGWDIPRYIKEMGIDNNKVLTTYVCRTCRNYEIKPFTTKDTNCKHCGAQADLRFADAVPMADSRRKGQVTTSTTFGVTEEQLNEIYNLMDVYAHPFNSGGQEIPVQEAKLTELITLVTNYSCGTEYCTSESGGIPLEWIGRREETESQFIKAVTQPFSIVKGLEKVLKMDRSKRRDMERRAREFVIDNCSIKVVGKKYEELIDSLPFIEWDYDFKPPVKNSKYPMPEIVDNHEWLKDLYSKILLFEDEEGEKYWLAELAKGVPRIEIYKYFIDTARRENAKNEPFDLEKIFSMDDFGRRVLFVIPQSIGDCFICTALFESIKRLYPEHNLYVATKPEYFEVFEGNPYVHKTIPFISMMEDEMIMMGTGESKGFVDVVYLPHIHTQKFLSYLSKDKIDLELK